MHVEKSLSVSAWENLELIPPPHLDYSQASDMHLTMIQNLLANAQTAHGCNFRAAPFQVFSAGNRGVTLLEQHTFM